MLCYFLKPGSTGKKRGYLLVTFHQVLAVKEEDAAINWPQEEEEEVILEEMILHVRLIIILLQGKTVDRHK